MTGPLRVANLKEKIKKHTRAGLSTSVIAERLGINTRTVYRHQLDLGLRTVQNPRKKEEDHAI